MRRTTFMAACTAIALTWGLGGTASAQRLDAPATRDVYFTFSEPVVVPNRTLPAGKYLFRVIGDGRTIVQIYAGDRSKLLHTAMSVQTMRADQPERAEIRLIESSAGTPVAVGTWWYPEMRQGWEFVYPRAQAVTLAKTAKQPILTTAENVALDDAAAGKLVRLEPSGQQSDYAATDNRPLTGTARVGEPAEADASANLVTTRAAVSQQAQVGTTRTTLPQTAGGLPSIALFGLLSLVAAALVGLGRRVA